MKGLPQIFLGGMGALWCAIAIWIAVYARGIVVGPNEINDSVIYFAQAMQAQSRIEVLSLAAIAFLIGTVFIVGACIVHHLDRAERR